MNDTRAGKKDKYQHIQVFVRVRPTNNTERTNKCTDIVEIPNNKEVILLERPHDKYSKKFKFDNVFGPSSKQIEVYNVVVCPLLEQVLAGYNCTVFAYGQTGTGKTFTMEGTNRDPTLHWQSDSPAGMIPRALSHLFDKLLSLESQEYTIRVSFLELYNEDLFDLLSPNDDGSKIRLYEDTSKKGAVIVHGLEEVTIRSKSEVYKILEKGSERRQTAATLMNSQSSRSHTVFSITVHMKENTIDGEEVLKTGKLNLVDLAGSENIGRSGAVDKRAREAGSINQSLLTLGRVITALVERAPHIPYRESKLTRLLQESLGGRTKTSIIATVSPANINFEETLSTLDYAHRAKNITNRPEINQKLSKREFLKQYTEEIERLRRDLIATRERNGVYLADDNYNEMQTLIAQQMKEIEKKLNNIKALEKAMEDKEKIFHELELQNVAQTQELHESKAKLDSAIGALKSTNSRLMFTTQQRDEQMHLVEKYAHTEQSLLSQAETLLSVADIASTDSNKLHDKIARKKETEQMFEARGKEFQCDVSEGLRQISDDISMYGVKLKQFGVSIEDSLVTRTSTIRDAIDTAIHKISIDFTKQRLCATENLTKTINETHSLYQQMIEEEIRNTVDTVESQNKLLSIISTKLAENIFEKIIENEIARNLQMVRSTVSEKIKQTTVLMKEMIDSACAYELENYNRTSQDLKIIVKDIETLRRKQEYSEKQKLLAKMMTDAFAEFKSLNKNQQEHYSAVTNECNCISNICKEVNDQTKDTYDTIIAMNNNAKEQIESGIEEIENVVTLGTKLNEDLSIKSAEQGKLLIDELKSNMNESCNVLEQYKNHVKCNAKEMQMQMIVHKNEAVSLIDSAYKVVVDVSKNHAEFMEDRKTKASEAWGEISKKLKGQITESRMWNENVVQELQETINEVNEFFDNDIQRDIPTGATPARKEFSYPRQFEVTSPHERILHRFRESRKLVETAEDDDDSYTTSDITMKQIANSTAISDVTIVSSPCDSTLFVTSALDDFLSKHTMSRISTESQLENTTQTLDASSISMQSRTQCGSEMYIKNENKENGECSNLSGKGKTTQPSKLQKPRRRVLRSYN